MTRTCVQSSSLGSCLVQEIEVGRSIQESPLTRLPSYSTWNSTSPTREASCGKRHPSVVNYCTKKKAERLRMYVNFSVTDVPVYIYETGEQKTLVSFWICSQLRILNVSNNCVASSSTAAGLKNNRLSPNTFMPKLHEDWPSSVKCVKCVQTRSDSKMCSYPGCRRIQTGAETIRQLIYCNHFDHWLII